MGSIKQIEETSSTKVNLSRSIARLMQSILESAWYTSISCWFPHYLLQKMLLQEQNRQKTDCLSIKMQHGKGFSEIISSLNSSLDPDTKVGTLSVAAQQQVEIIKALYRKVDVLILDEPTAVLTPTEVVGLFKVLRTLRDEGMSIVIITHKLKETLNIADRITVLRDGHIINSSVDPKNTNIHELSKMMVGRQIKNQ